MHNIKKEVKAMPEEERSLIVVHLTLKDPLGVQDLHLTEIREIDTIGTAHTMSLKRQYLLPLMVI